MVSLVKDIEEDELPDLPEKTLDKRERAIKIIELLRESTFSKKNIAKKLNVNPRTINLWITEGKIKRSPKPSNVESLENLLMPSFFELSMKFVSKNNPGGVPIESTERYKFHIPIEFKEDSSEIARVILEKSYDNNPRINKEKYPRETWVKIREPAVIAEIEASPFWRETNKPVFKESKRKTPIIEELSDLEKNIDDFTYTIYYQNNSEED